MTCQRQCQKKIVSFRTVSLKTRTNMNNIAEFTDRYVAVWNQPEADLRRKGVIALWAEDGANLTRTIEARGYEALEARVTRAHEKWVTEEGFVFRALNGVAHHHNVATFSWGDGAGGRGTGCYRRLRAPHFWR
jgi:hypothetical protein